VLQHSTDVPGVVQKPGPQLLKKVVDRVGQKPVLVGHNAACIMGVQFYAHITVLVVKTGMVGMLLGQKCHTCHEGECFLKILKSKFPDQTVVLLEPHLLRFML